MGLADVGTHVSLDKSEVHCRYCVRCVTESIRLNSDITGKRRTGLLFSGGSDADICYVLKICMA